MFGNGRKQTDIHTYTLGSPQLNKNVPVSIGAPHPLHHCIYIHVLQLSEREPMAKVGQKRGLALFQVFPHLTTKECHVSLQ